MRANYCSNCGQNLYGCYDDADQPCHACPPGDNASVAKFQAMLSKPWLQPDFFKLKYNENLGVPLSQYKFWRFR